VSLPAVSWSDQGQGCPRNTARGCHRASRL